MYKSKNYGLRSEQIKTSLNKDIFCKRKLVCSTIASSRYESRFKFPLETHNKCETHVTQIGHGISGGDSLAPHNSAGRKKSRFSVKKKPKQLNLLMCVESSSIEESIFELF